MCSTYGTYSTLGKSTVRDSHNPVTISVKSSLVLNYCWTLFTYLAP